VIGVFVVGVAAGVAATAAFYALHHQRSWQEQEAQSRADAIACNITQVGLGAKPCGKLLSFRKTAPYTWDARIEADQHTYCVRLHTYEPARPCTRHG
jgi:hypothetical protein